MICTPFPNTVVPLLKATLTRGHPSYEARIFCLHYYKVNRFLPIAKGHLSYVATICSQIGWPYKRGTTVLLIMSRAALCLQTAISTGDCK